MRKIVLALALLISLSGCGYSLAGRGSFLPASIKVIGVPLFTNNTNISELERRVTDKVRAEFAGRGKLTSQEKVARFSAITLCQSGLMSCGNASRNSCATFNASVSCVYF